MLVVVLGLIVLAVLWLAGTYNSLVQQRMRTTNAWSQIDVQLKRRYDLIPNLVETAKGYMAHERGVLENVTRARSMAVEAKGVADQAKAENMLTQTLRSLFAVVENYPDLKANQNMLALQEELTSTENKIGFARQHYNEVVRAYNTSLQTVPTNVVAGMFRFAPKEFFEVEAPEERQAVKVKF
ncbi:MAG: LemA family protein [Planctomycetota bacterium]